MRLGGREGGRASGVCQFPGQETNESAMRDAESANGGVGARNQVEPSRTSETKARVAFGGRAVAYRR